MKKRRPPRRDWSRGVRLRVRHHDGTETEHATHEEAYAAAVADMAEGERLGLHAIECGMTRRRKCDCEPVVVTVRRGKA